MPEGLALVIRTAIQKAWSLPDLPNPTEIEIIVATWRAWASIDSWRLWRSLDAK